MMKEPSPNSDQYFFEFANIIDSTKTRIEAAQIEDGIPDKLSGAVVGDIAATVDLVYLHAARSQKFISGQNVRAAGVSSQCQHWRMFQKQQNIADALLMTQFDECFLQRQPCGVIKASEIENRKDHLFRKARSPAYTGLPDCITR